MNAVSNAAILAVIREVDATSPAEEVNEVEEKDSAPEVEAPEKAAKRASHRDAFRQQMLAAGCDPAKVDELVAVKQVAGSRQRNTPTWATVCDPATVAFWKDRSDEQIEADTVKLLRRDGGQKGPAAVYAQTIFDTIIVDETGTCAEVLHVDEAAERINAHVGRRIYSMRLFTVMAINELRRRRAVKAGVDPKGITYLKVSAPPVVADTDGADPAVNTIASDEKPAEPRRKKDKAPPVPPLTEEEESDPDMVEALALTHGNVEYARAYLTGRRGSAADAEEVDHG